MFHTQSITTIVDPCMRLRLASQVSTLACAQINYGLATGLAVAVIRSFAGMAEACRANQLI
jgi:hypothetical protein